MSERFILTGGLLCDGTGQEACIGEVLIENGVIQAVTRGVSNPADGIPRVECYGNVVAPGFIDLTSNMDFYARLDAPVYFESFTRQGVTSFVTGQNGYSPFATCVDSPYQSLLNHPPFDIGQTEQPALGLRQFRHSLNKNNLDKNSQHQVIPMAGHGSSRLSIAGHEVRALSGKDRERLLGLLEEALQDGAMGISIGLHERPGLFSMADELTAVALLVQRYNKVLRVHGRCQSALSGAYSIASLKRHNVKAVEEMLTLARTTGVNLQCSQLAFTGNKTWQTMESVLDKLSMTRAIGVDVQFDFSPHAVGITSLMNILPQWFVKQWRENSHSLVQRARLFSALTTNFRLSGLRYNDICLVSAESDVYDVFEGSTIDHIAQDLNQTAFATMLDILHQSSGRARVMLYERYGVGMTQRLMEHECSLFASGAAPEPVSGQHNPSAFAAFPRFLQIARNTGALSMEHCVRKMTGAVADKIGLRDRGFLLEGRRADITVFNWNSIMDLTDFAGFNATPEGIEQVYVGGECLLRDGKLVDVIGRPVSA